MTTSNTKADNFSRQIKEWRARVAELQKRTDSKPLSQNGLLEVAEEELQTALEELAVAEEELHQQNEELCRQNEELCRQHEELCRQHEELLIARKEVETERQRYKQLFELAPDGYLITDTQGTIQEANRAAALLLNLSQSFIVGKPLIAFVEESERVAFQAQLTKPHVGDWVREWEVRMRPHGLDSIDALLTVANMRDRNLRPVALHVCMRDITLRKQAESQLLHKAFHDALTGLPNRALFMNRLGRAVEYGKRHKNYLFAVMFLDLERFKAINDSFGHTIGDQLLIAFARRLEGCLRPTDTAARLGGDEFTILLEGISDIDDAIKVADRIQRKLKLPFDLGDQEVFTTASIGIASSATGYDRPSDLLYDADTAMYRAKNQGLARYEIFNTDMHIRAVASPQW